MNKTTFLVLLCAGLFSGCRTSSPRAKTQLEPAIGALYGATLAPLADMFMLKYGSLDLLYDTASFRNRTGRWPTNQAELAAFVENSNGYLWLGSYKRIGFTSLTNGNLEISYIRAGHTNDTKFTISDVLSTK